MRIYGKLIVLLGLFTGIFSYAQSPDEYQILDPSGGLPHPHVTSIVQDPVGFMWFGTRNGLVRYDGHRYISFTVGTQNARLSSNQINYLFIDSSSGFLWIGTEAGLDKLDLKTYRSERIKIPKNLISNIHIVLITQTRDKTM